MDIALAADGTRVAQPLGYLVNDAVEHALLCGVAFRSLRLG
jgi:hypothetical protein